jgi:hypothetical protein
LDALSEEVLASDLCRMSENQAGGCCGKTSKEEKNCQKESKKSNLPCRVIYLKSNFQTTLSCGNIKIEPHNIDLLLFTENNNNLTVFLEQKLLNQYNLKKPPISGRQILSKKSVLII